MTPVVFALLMLTAGADEAKAPLTSQAMRQFDAALQEGRLDDAEGVLERYEVPTETLYRMRGALRLKQGNVDAAIDDLEAAVKSAPDVAVLKLYLAAALLEGGRAADALTHLPADAPLLKTEVSAGLIRGRALAATGKTGEAFATYQFTSKRFPVAQEPLLEALVLSVANGLEQEAVDLGHRLFSLPEVSAASLRLVAQALTPVAHALPLLESIAARLPADVAVARAVGIAYANAGMTKASARWFERVEAMAPGTAATFAAEQWALAQNFDAALVANAQVTDAKARIEQRIRLLFTAGRMARVVGLQPQAKAASALTNSVRYQLAYAHYRLHQPANAIALARTLLGTEFETSALALLEAMGASHNPRRQDQVQDR